MNVDLQRSGKRVVAELRELATLTSDGDGAQRVAWTPTWQKARDWFSNQAQAVGAEVSVDAAGNTWAKIQGKSDDGIIVGSHLDCVPSGGWLDGSLGVVAALEILRRYSGEERKPKKTVYAVNWADEEGARFGRSLLGVSAASGTLDVREIIGCVDNEGTSIIDALGKYDVDLHNIQVAHEQFKEKNIVGCIELHIEQGPVLEDRKKMVACVYGITGVERHCIRFRGQAAHAGSFPTLLRSDAFLAAAQASLAFKEIALKYDGVCTVGKVKVLPDVVTIVPESCTISLDQRSIDADKLESMYQEARQAVEKAACDQHVQVEWEKIWTIAPTIFDARFVELCKKAVKDETGEETMMYSGPLHDIAEMAKLVPAVMVFAMSEKGLSHCKEENTSDEALETAARVFFRLADEVIC